MMQVMMTTVSPFVQITLWLVFGVPLAVLFFGVLLYFLKPNQRSRNGKLMIAIGSFEFIIYLIATRALTLVGATMYTIELLTIIVGIVFLIQSRTTNSKSLKRTATAL